MGEVSKKVSRKNKDLESTLTLTISAQDGLIDQKSFFGKKISGKNISNYFLIKKGEFAYNKSYSNGHPWGAIKRLDKYDLGILSTLYIVFRPIDIDSQFLVSYYDSSSWHQELRKSATEGARNHGLLNISSSDFFNNELNITIEKIEQQKIGTFFQKLDNLITLHQDLKKK